MTILRERRRWTRTPSEATLLRRLGTLTPEEQENVRRAIRVLRVRLGSGANLAAAMGLTLGAAQHLAVPSRRIGARQAVRVARLAGVEVGDVLAGRWPPPGTCPHCGRASEVGIERGQRSRATERG